jgi:hypothetical protein
MAERRTYPAAETFHLTRGLNTVNGVLNSPVRPEFAHTAINTSVTPEDAAKMAEKNNTAGHIRQEFFNPENGKGNVLSVTTDESSNSNSSRVRLTAAYTELASAEFAANGHVFRVSENPDPEERAKEQTAINAEQVPTHTVYDLPFATQVSYWSEVLESLDIYHATLEDFSDPYKVTIFAGENAVKERTGKIRTSRSIAIPHAHTVPLEHDTVTELPDGDPTMAHVNYEQRVLEKIGQKLADRVHENLPQDAQSKLLDTMEGDDPNLKLRKRLVKPFGYQLQLPSDISITDFASFMEDHHHAYVGTTDEIVERLSVKNQKRIIPQPSYRMYVFKEDQGKGDISVIISPEFISHGGLIEAAGLKLNRSVDNEPKHDPELVDGLMEVLKAGQDTPWYKSATWQEVRAKVVTRD